MRNHGDHRVDGYFAGVARCAPVTLDVLRDPQHGLVVTGDDVAATGVLAGVHPVLVVRVGGHLAEVVGDSDVLGQPDRSFHRRVGGLHGGEVPRVDAERSGKLCVALVAGGKVVLPHTRQCDRVVEAVVRVEKGTDRVRNRVHDAESARVECLTGDVLRVHHSLAGLEVARLVDRFPQVLRDEFHRVQGVAQRRREVEAGDERLTAVRQHVESAVRGEVLRAGVVEQRVVDGDGDDGRFVEGDPLVRVVHIGGVGDDVCPRGFRTRSRRCRYGDVRRVLLVRGLGESLELVDVAAVVGDDDARTLCRVVARAATNGDDAVALLLLVEGRGLHDVVVLGVRLDLVEQNHLDALVLDLADQFLDDAGSAQAGGDEQRALEAEVLRLDSDDVVRADSEEGAREGVEFLDREVPDLIELDSHRILLVSAV